jgi:hypothetical protein
MFRTLKIALFCFCFAAGAVAHHSTVAVYDAEDTITLEGTVTQVEWRNPHIWFYIDVVGDDGNVTNWGVEFQTPPARMLRSGWTQESLQVGDVVTVEGSLPRNRELTRVLSQTTILPDGRILGDRGRTNRAR